MMLRSDSKAFGFAAGVGGIILLLCLAGQGYCEQDSSALVLDVSPVNGGTVNLSPGVHIYDRDSEVTLIAVPKPGYQFVYWLGNVTNANSSSTSVYLDSPKIVVAVFERSKFEIVEFEEAPQISVSGGGLVPRGGDYAAGLEQAIGAKRPSGFHFPRPPEPPPPNDKPPVPPDKGNENPPAPEVPEPATIAFIFAGMLSLVKCRHRRVKTIA